MINYINSIPSAFSLHHISRKETEDKVRVKDIPVAIENDVTKELMLRYLLSGFKEPAYYKFNFSSGNIEENPVYKYAREIFDDQSILHEYSKKIAQYLYFHSSHPNIREGVLIMCYFRDLLLEDEMLDAVGIFKAESKTDFLQLIESKSSYDVDTLKGLASNSLDKGCLIFNTSFESGYKVCILDKANSSEAFYWTNDFLNIVEREDDYQFTKHYIQLTKDYVQGKRKLSDDFNKQDEISVMNASENYFKGNEVFSEQEYLEEVLGSELVDDFANFKRDAQFGGGMALQSQFDISEAAVKKKNKVFKSVIKLDSNFHIYVHGDRTKIERGEDDFGRKYYKLYYDTEN